MKFAFVTCVELGLACMKEIDQAGGTLDLVITLKDRLASEKSGRIYVDDFCKARNIDVLKIRSINDDVVVQELKRRRIDWLFIIGWSQIASTAVLRAPSRGVLGMHPTLLPNGRGRASIPWAILKGLPETGVTLFQLDEGVDTGPILAQERLLITSEETATTLYRRIAEAHQKLMRYVWQDLAEDRLTPVAQDESLATVWPGRTPADGRIQASMTVSMVDRLVRATTRPYPGAFWDDGDRRVRIWAGRIVEPESKSTGQVSSTNATSLRITLADGVYEAQDFDLIDLATQAGANE